MFIYTADPATLQKLKKAKHNRKLDVYGSYNIAQQNAANYSEILAVLCLYEQVKYVSLTKLEMIPVGNTALHSSLFKEEEYSCNIKKED